MKKNIFSLIGLFLFFAGFVPTCLIATGDSSSASFSNVFPSFSSAFGSGSSASYSNVTNLGPLISGDSSSPGFRSFSGFLPTQIKVIDFTMSFLDESPVSNDAQLTPGVTAKITVQISGGNTIAQVKYRISNTGSNDSDFTWGWESDAVRDSVIIAGKKERWSIAIPNTAGHGFLEGNNNYIQWQAFNNAGENGQSGIYRVSVSTNDIPLISITQPDIKSEFTSMSPFIAASITDQVGGIDAAAIQIKIDDAAGNNVTTVKSSADPSIYDSTKHALSYKYAGPALSANASYALTVTATDKLGKSGSASATFVPKSGAIADLIPYPSPFDPKVQPIVIRYVLDKRSDVWVNIYNMAGRIVKTVTEAQSRDAGVCEDLWYGTNFGGEELANGVYFCELVAKNADGEFRRFTSLAIFGK